MPRASPLEVVERIYDAALNPERWGDAVSSFRGSFDAVVTGLFVAAAEDNRLLTGVYDGIATSDLKIYNERFSQNNPWHVVPGLLVPGSTVTDRTLERVHGRSDAFVRTEMFQEWCKRLDCRHTLGSGMADVEGNQLKFTMYRPAVAGHYTQREIEVYKQLVRHMLKAVEINRQLAAAQSQLRMRDEVLDQLRLGVVGLDWARRILMTNARAAQMLEARNGVMVSGARLTASSSQAVGVLEAAIEQALRHRRSSTISVARTGQRDLSVSVLPAVERRSLFDLDRVHAIVLMADPQDREIGDSGYLARRWQLAPLEAQFAQHLLQGKSVAEAAEAMKLTRATAQWYCKQVMAKVGVRRQSELVLKLMNDLPAFIRSASRGRN